VHACCVVAGAGVRQHNAVGKHDAIAQQRATEKLASYGRFLTAEIENQEELPSQPTPTRTPKKP
jgi:hypothetical protein